MQNHPLMLLGTTAFLNSQPDLRVTASALTPEESFDRLAVSLPDVVVIEVSINGPFDFPFLERLRERHPRLPILVFSYHEEVIFARRALEAGANGYLMKEAKPDKLAEALRQILAGEIYLSDRVTARIEQEQSLRAGHLKTHLNGALVNSLSNRELQIFQLLGDGYPLARIQQELGLTRKGLTSACYRMRRKLGLANETELVQFACHWAYYEGDFS
jgi:DNA-binding NarL/FixJ family response regulator